MCSEISILLLSWYTEYDINTKIISSVFSTSEKPYSLEADTLLSYRFLLKAVAASTLERQNVDLVLQIFYDYVIQTLLTIGKHHYLLFFSEVAGCIQDFHIWSSLTL